MTYAAAYRRRYESTNPIRGYGFVFPSRGAPAAPIVEEFKELGARLYVFFLSVPESDVAKDQRELMEFEAAISSGEEALVQQIRNVLEPWLRIGDSVDRPRRNRPFERGGCRDKISHLAVVLDERLS